MATYTAVFHTSLAVEIKANSYEEAVEKVDNICNSNIIDGQNLEDMWFQFDELLEY